MLASQIKLLFRALSQNRQLEYLNLAMVTVGEGVKLPKLKEFIRENDRLLHLDLSGMFKLAEHVREIIKAVTKSASLLALHLSHTLVIEDDLKLQSYIRSKMGMESIVKKPRNKPSTKKGAKAHISQNWVLRDKMQVEVSHEESVTKFFNNQRLADSTAANQLIFQRTIDLHSSPGNQKWIGSRDCYICQRWQLTCFLFNPAAALATGEKE